MFVVFVILKVLLLYILHFKVLLKFKTKFSKFVHFLKNVNQYNYFSIKILPIVIENELDAIQ